VKQTILLVDDDPTMLLIWQKQLESLGVNIITASSIPAAIEHMHRIPPPDLVLLDLVVPPHSAKDTVAEIDTLRAFNPNLTIIVISGMGQDDIAKLVAHAKVEGVVSKQDAQTQVDLLRVMKSALDKGCGSSQLLMRVSETIRNLQIQ